VPFIGGWPGQVPAGAVDSTTVISAIDLPLTLCRRPAGTAQGDHRLVRRKDMSPPARNADRARPRQSLGVWPHTTSFASQESDRSPNVAVRCRSVEAAHQRRRTSRELYNIGGRSNETTMSPRPIHRAPRPYERRCVETALPGRPTRNRVGFSRQTTALLFVTSAEFFARLRTMADCGPGGHRRCESRYS